jgi:glycerate dehydrogenase
MATGHDVVDVRAASENGIVVTNIPSYSTSSIAQGAIAFLLELTNNVGHHNQTVHDGKWCKSLDFCYWERPIIELKGLKLGVIGFGAIGRSVANIASALGMSILTNSRTKRESPPGLEAKFCDLETLLKESDVVTLHCPLTPQTIGLIGYKALGMMKKSAFLLNTARGGLIVEQDLADALNSGEIAGAALDVLSTEPPNESNPLFSARNCIITPHHCWASMATRKELLGQTAANLRAYLSGQPINVVNP